MSEYSLQAQILVQSVSFLFFNGVGYIYLRTKPKETHFMDSFIMRQ